LIEAAILRCSEIGICKEPEKVTCAIEVFGPVRCGSEARAPLQIGLISERNRLRVTVRNTCKETYQESNDLRWSIAHASILGLHPRSGYRSSSSLGPMVASPPKKSPTKKSPIDTF
jgi:hypothetical protein